MTRTMTLTSDCGTSQNTKYIVRNLINFRFLSVENVSISCNFVNFDRIQLCCYPVSCEEATEQ